MCVAPRSSTCKRSPMSQTSVIPPAPFGEGKRLQNLVPHQSQSSLMRHEICSPCSAIEGGGGEWGEDGGSRPTGVPHAKGTGFLRARGEDRRTVPRIHLWNGERLHAWSREPQDFQKAPVGPARA